MLDVQEKDMRLKFLQRNYPVYRLKYNMRFKRTIILDDGQGYLLSDKENQTKLFYGLFDILKTVFYSDDNLSKNVVKEFLNMK